MVDGSWSPWGPCADGHQSRQCDSPVPDNGGAPCFGDSMRPCTPSTDQTGTQRSSLVSWARQAGFSLRGGREGGDCQLNLSGDESPKVLCMSLVKFVWGEGPELSKLAISV